MALWRPKKKAYAPGYSMEWKAAVIDDPEEQRREVDLMSDKWKQVEFDDRNVQARVKFSPNPGHKAQWTIEIDKGYIPEALKGKDGQPLVWEDRQEARDFLEKHRRAATFMGQLESL